VSARDEELASVLRACVNADSTSPTREQRRAMWQNIANGRAEERIYGDVSTQLLDCDNGITRVKMRVVLARRSTWWTVSAASALLAAGIVIGVGIRRTVVNQTSLVATAATHANMAQITADHFAASKRLLITVSARSNESDASTADAVLVTRARALLSTTQILLDSPAGVDATKRQLLGDLELVLVQIVQLAPESFPGDRELVARAIAGRRMIPRLQSAMPAGAMSGT
jgi:hypothetical protein